MKVILTALVTAAVLAGAALAGSQATSPTTAQFVALSKRVTALTAQVVTLKGQQAAAQQQLTCVVKGWNAQTFEAYVKPSVHFASSNSDLTIFAVPSSDTTGPYFVASPTIMPQC